MSAINAAATTITARPIPAARRRIIVSMIWELLLAIASLLLAVAAYARSRTAGGFYDADVYGMTPQAHGRYAAIALGFALAFFAVALWWPRSAATIWLGAAFVLFAVIYVTSFLRGATESDD
jgi:hypothetical protein